MKIQDIEGRLAEEPEVVSLGELLARVATPGRTTWRDLPTSPGIYVVSLPAWGARSFNARAGQAQHAATVDPRILIDKRNRILAGGPTDILYIGKAGNLRKRVRQLVRFGVGRANNHHGGEWLWQLEGIREAQLWMWSCPGERPESLERRLLEEFRAGHGELSLANRI